MNSMLYTIGHSNHGITAFIKLLRMHGIPALADVRSHPYSRYVQHFSREPLKASLAANGINYVFLGKELGARSDNPACYHNGKVQYDLLAREPKFAEGLKRVREGMEHYRIALVCTERDPLDCHRVVLVSRKLHDAGIEIHHIHANSSIESHEKLESRLLAACNLPESDLFKSREELLSKAYSTVGERIAYQDNAMGRTESVAVS